MCDFSFYAEPKKVTLSKSSKQRVDAKGRKMLVKGYILPLQVKSCRSNVWQGDGVNCIVYSEFSERIHLQCSHLSHTFVCEVTNVLGNDCSDHFIIYIYIILYSSNICNFYLLITHQ